MTENKTKNNIHIGVTNSAKIDIFGGKYPWGANENFLAHSNEAKSFRATISNICAKIIKI